MSRKVSDKTVREFASGVNVWETLERWSLETGYALVRQDQTSRTYQKGSNPVFVPTFVKLTWKNPGYRLETWLEPPGINRFVSLGTIPRVLGLESGGVTGSVPRIMARRSVNCLLDPLGVPPVRRAYARSVFLYARHNRAEHPHLDRCGLCVNKIYAYLTNLNCRGAGL